MSKLEKLLQGVKVEWLPLGELLTRTKGTSITASQMKILHKENAPIKIFAGGKTVAFVNYSDIPEKDINLEPSIIVKSRGVIEFEYYEKPFSHKNEMWSYNAKEKNVDLKFIYYFLKENEQYFQNIGNKMQMPQISIPVTDNYLCPIPCPDNPKKSLEIQQEIVRILDELTDLTTQLKKELETERQNRKKQFEYYREELFRFEEKQVEWKTFGDLGEIIRGNGLQKTDFRVSGVGCIHYGQIYTYYGNFATQTKSFVSNELAEKLKKVNKGDLIITNTSENIEDVCKAVAWLGDDEIVTGGHACILKHNQNPKFLVYYTQLNEFFKDKKKLAKGTKVMDVSAKDLAKIKVPIPSLAEQERIVNLLDKLNENTMAITKELENEINLTTKQYEYYREKLLTFK